ncbi:MAG: hypothetical protein J6B62_02620 [Bacteroidales bacterium]|nr:hypothetical protein [Bacteroidales bacterium]
MKTTFSKIFFALSLMAAGLAGASCDKPVQDNGDADEGGTPSITYKSQSLTYVSSKTTVAPELENLTAEEVTAWKLTGIKEGKDDFVDQEGDAAAFSFDETTGTIEITPKNLGQKDGSYTLAVSATVKGLDEPLEATLDVAYVFGVEISSVTVSYEAPGQGKVGDEITVESGFEGKTIKLDSESEYVANKLKIYKSPAVSMTPAVEGITVSGYGFSSITLNGEPFDNASVNNLFSINETTGQITFFTSKLYENYGTYSVSVNATVLGTAYETKDVLVVEYEKGEIVIKSASLSYVDNGHFRDAPATAPETTGDLEEFAGNQITFASTSEYKGAKIEKKPTLVIDPSNKNLKVDEGSYKITSITKNGEPYDDSTDKLFGDPTDNKNINAKSGQITIYTSKFKEAHAGTYTLSVSFTVNGQAFTTENALAFTYVHVKPEPKVSYESEGNYTSEIVTTSTKGFAGSTINLKSDDEFVKNKAKIYKPAKLNEGTADDDSFALSVTLNDEPFDNATKKFFEVNTAGNNKGRIALYTSKLKTNYGTFKVSVTFKIDGIEYTTSDALVVNYAE